VLLAVSLVCTQHTLTHTLLCKNELESVLNDELESVLNDGGWPKIRSNGLTKTNVFSIV
jgi:hypothetical protein